MTKFHQMLKRMGACSSAMRWAKSYDDPQRAWDQCDRGDWMLWLCDRMAGNSASVERKNVVMVACECARLSLKYVKPGEDRPRKAIETAERLARGEKGVTIENVRSAASSAASSAYTASAAYAASYAAFAASYAALASASAAASDADADAADAAYAADAASAYAAARKITLRNCADIVRDHYPVCPLLSYES